MKAKMKSYKTGGVLVGLNGNQAVQTVPGSKGVMPGLNAKASAQTKPGGWSGGTSKAPDWAMPSAKKGGMMKTKKK